MEIQFPVERIVFSLSFFHCMPTLENCYHLVGHVRREIWCAHRIPAYMAIVVTTVSHMSYESFALMWYSANGVNVELMWLMLYHHTISKIAWKLYMSSCGAEINWTKAMRCGDDGIRLMAGCAQQIYALLGGNSSAKNEGTLFYYLSLLAFRVGILVGIRLLIEQHISLAC